jgi:hypothetical protein
VPRRAFQVSPHKTTPDFVQISGGARAVCDEFRAMVEALEPGVHQFFPVELLRKDGSPVILGREWFLLNICNRVDAVVVERSNIYWEEKPGGRRVMHPRRQPPGLVLRRSAIAGRHLWRGLTHLRVNEFWSDALMREVQRAKLRKVRAVPLEESEN